MRINGERLREARLFNQMTMSDLAKKIGVSKQMISKYEHGKSEISLKSFQKLLKALDFPLDYFNSYTKVSFKDMGTFYRSSLTATQSEKQPSEMYKKAAAYLRDYFEKYVNFPQLDTHLEISGNPEESAGLLRKKWNLSEGTPIEDIVNLLERHGINIVAVDFNTTKVDARSGYVSIGQNKYYIVLINFNKQNFFRNQFTLAHELGHYVMHANIYQPQEDLNKKEYRDIERDANTFASAFLMPKESFLKDLDAFKERTLSTFINLKSKWNVSIAAMIHRAHELKWLDDNDYLKLQKQISYRHWRIHEILDDEKPISRPKALYQAFELLEQHHVVEPNTLNDKLRDNYGVVFPNKILSQTLGIDLNRFSGSIVQIKNNIDV